MHPFVHCFRFLPVVSLDCRRSKNNVLHFLCLFVLAFAIASRDGIMMMPSCMQHRYTRDVELADNEFAWIGLSAMAGWGYTNEDDGTGGQQPRHTRIARNYVREIGLIEKQVRPSCVQYHTTLTHK